MKTFILLIAILLSSFTYASSTFYRPDQYFSLEYAYLINSLQSKKLTKAQTKKLNNHIHLIDHLAHTLGKEKMHIFLKSEIYKIIFKNRPQQKLSSKLYKKATLKTLDKKLASSNNILSPFTSWFIEALITDLNILFNSKRYPQILKIITHRQKLKNDNERTFKKKLDIILAWTNLIIKNGFEEIEDNLTTIMFKINHRLDKYGKLYLKLSKTKNRPSNKPLLHFTLAKKAPDKKGITYINYLLDLKNMGIKNDREKTPKFDWLPKDAPDSITIPTSKHKSKIYDNDILPVPLNDWPVDIE